MTTSAQIERLPSEVPFPSTRFRTRRRQIEDERIPIEALKSPIAFKQALILSKSPNKAQRTLDFATEERDSNLTTNDVSPEKHLNGAPTFRKSVSKPFQPTEIDEPSPDKQQTLRIAGTLPQPTSKIRKSKAKVTFECKFCSEQDELQNFIRPCLCRGSMQHVHQKCVQEHIRQNYMDAEKMSFIKPLECDICRFKFVIKSYQLLNILEALSNAKTKHKMRCLLFCLFCLVGSIFGVSIALGLHKEKFQQQLDILTLVCFFCFLCFSLIIVVGKQITELSLKYEWRILDRNEINRFDSGMPMTLQNLNCMLRSTRFGLQPSPTAVVPLEDHIGPTEV